MSGETLISASRKDVWEALNDPAVLRQCIPGCEEVTVVGENELRATVVSKVGPIKARFGGKVILSELDPPNGYVISGEGNGGAAGVVHGSAKVSLTSQGDQTVLRYTCDAQISGKLAQIGSRLVETFARRTADEFFSRFAMVVAGGGELAHLKTEPNATETREAAPVNGRLPGGPQTRESLLAPQVSGTTTGALSVPLLSVLTLQSIAIILMAVIIIILIK